ncbi:hypothetical protein HYZ97_05095 [Candidatus Pacearchaeota archaeon]|nr:hypothetical protein [Candidatus Pacearchaeota archaeon]
MVGKSVEAVFKKKNRALKKGILIPDDFIAEMEAYCVRNAVIEKVHNLTGLHHCCPACVKAHAVKHASSIGLNREASGVITKFFRGDIGHDGYYLDQEKLIKL